MNTACIGRYFRSLLAPAVVLSAMLSTPATAAESCACLCVDGAPYNVCNSFAGSTKQPTETCDAQLADTCPAPDAAPDVETPIDPPVTSVEEHDPVNAAARANGLDCQPRQVYRPDLAQHKVYTVCMPQQAMAATKARSTQETPGRSVQR